MIVINDQTSPGLSEKELKADIDRSRQNLPGLTDELIADFIETNKQPLVLEPLLNISLKYVFVTRQELEAIFEGSGGWGIFYEKYPNSQGQMALSRVGFNQQMNVAMLYVGNQSDWLAGAGFYVLLGKVSDKWTVQAKMMAWIS